MPDPAKPEAPPDAPAATPPVETGGAPARPQPDPDTELPDPERIARRALVVATLAWRSSIERDRPPGAEAQIAVATRWAEAHGLVEEMEPEEVALLRAPAWSWTERTIRDRSWAVEGAAVLAWALGGDPIPSHDQPVDAAALAKKLGLFTDEPEVLEEWVLRSIDELARMRDRILAVSWRLRTFAAKPGAMDLGSFLRQRWSAGAGLEGLAAPGGDLALGGVPIARADEAALRTARSIAVERHRAIEWICGADALWSKVGLLARS